MRASRGETWRRVILIKAAAIHFAQLCERTCAAVILAALSALADPSRLRAAAA